MRPVNAIGYLLQHVSSILAKQSDQVLHEQLGIGFSQFKILRTLQSNPHTMQRDIADRLGQTEASISRQVKLMVTEDLLQYMISPKDHREHITVITPKGIRLTDAAVAVLNKYHAPTFAVLSDKQLSQLNVLLETLHGQTCLGEHPDSTKLNQE
jgi:DNA-binding MarR family transcriptional regulator